MAGNNQRNDLTLENKSQRLHIITKQWHLRSRSRTTQGLYFFFVSDSLLCFTNGMRSSWLNHKTRFITVAWMSPLFWPLGETFRDTWLWMHRIAEVSHVVRFLWKHLPFMWAQEWKSQINLLPPFVFSDFSGVVYGCSLLSLAGVTTSRAEKWR